MGGRKKAAEPRSQSAKNKGTKRNKSSRAIPTTTAITRSASSQVIRPSRAVEKQRLSSSSSGTESSDASDEYTPSSYTSPGVAAEEEFEALPDTSEGEDVSTEQDVADNREHSESDGYAIPAAKRRKTVSQNTPNPLNSTSSSQKTSSNTLTGKVSKTNVIGAWKFKPGIDATLPPMHDIGEIFEDITQKAGSMTLFTKFIKHLGGRKLNVATMCSGTESPLLALRLITDALGKNHNLIMQLNHQFSAEIVPFKQAYIERNFHPKILFRDINELAENDEASTAYGAPVTVPRDVDILIAGFSCVDFSRLNQKPKGLSEPGESGDTFRAILNYAKKYRPPIIVLENVNGAPWKDIKDWWQGAHYAAEYVRLDTKQYYIPHTRQRVYMICIDKLNFKSADAGVKKWASLMQKFERPASCSIESFLLNEDDPRVQMAREQLAKGSRGEDRGPREVDWTKCQGRHQDYRASLQLGTEKPATAWVNGGSCKTREFAWHEWNDTQVERVWDTEDMSYLRNASKGFDSWFKVRVWELSQNVDRFTDSAPFGVTGCITPTGQPFVTTRGGPLLGVEALAMQGLPVEQLILTRETQKQLQDLAGNAMTSTVVGVAILCALMVGYLALTEGPGETPSPNEQLPLNVLGLDDSALKKMVLDLTCCTYNLVSELCLMAQCSIRLCGCEGSRSITMRRLLVCEQCGHIACEKCAGIPKHVYRHLDQSQIQSRLTPHDFEHTIKGSLPMRLHLLGLDLEGWKKTRDLAVGTIEPQVWTIFIAAVKDVCKQELRFHSAKRTHCWTVTFDAPKARLELVFFRSRAQWYLYAKPDSKLPVNSEVRQLLKYPIARMVPKDNSLLEGLWEVRLPLKTSVPIIIEGRGNLTRSWESLLGLQAPQFVEKKVWTVLQVAVSSHLSTQLHLDIAGDYELLQNCGGASGSLHKRISNQSKDKPPLYLFLDVEPIGNPKEDKFVFSTDIQRPNCRDTRNIVASVESSWRQSSLEGPEAIKCDVEGEWVHTDTILQAFKRTEPATYAVPSEDISFHVSEGTPAWDPSVGFTNTRCTGATTAILSCEVPSVEGENIGWHSGPWVVVDENNERLVYASFSWLTEKARGLDGFLRKWRPLVLPDQHITCQNCAPDPPDLKWRLAQAGQTRKIMPYEDPRQAGQYERAMKSRAAPFVTYVRIDENKIGRLTIGLNVPTLAHRALAKLRDLASYDGVSCSWRLNTRYIWPSKPDLPRFKLTSNKTDKEASHVFPVKEEQNGVLKDLKLRKEQQRSLQWMVGQEHNPQPFLEQEIEEAHLQHLGWRAEVKVTRSRQTRGGVLADEVGYGKTATTLALIDAQSENAKLSCRSPCVGGLPLKATLIIVPRHLVPQWKTQVEKFLGKKYNVIVVLETRSLTSRTVHDFEQADIIIVAASLFTTESYLQKVSLFAALPEAPATAGRALDAWLVRATKRISENVEEMRHTEPVRKFADVLNARLTAAEADEELLRYVPSKRLRGKVYAAESAAKEAAKAAAAQDAAAQEGKGKKRTHEKQDSEVGVETTTPRMDPTIERKADAFGIATAKLICHISNPIFQMFRFNRLIIDEYTYVDAKGHAFMTSLQASSRWVLSGTPALDDFADVKTMASFLGVNLGVDDDTVGVMKGENLRAIRKDRTAAEHFHSYDHRLQSPKWHTQRHKHAQRFLDQFARQNTAEIDEIITKHELKAVNLPASERAILIELQQQVIAQDMKLREGGKAEIDNDRAKRLDDLMKTSDTPEEALLKCSSHFELPVLRSGDNALLACDVIIEARKEQYESLCMKLKDQLNRAARLMQRCESPSTHYMSWKGHVRENGFGDSKATKELVGMIDIAEAYSKVLVETELCRNNPIKKAKKVIIKAPEKKTENKETTSAGSTRSMKPETLATANALELRNLAGHLRSLSDELVSRARALRFFEAVHRVQLWQTEGGPAPVCAYCDRKASAPENIIVLGLCGHIVCDDCLATTEAGGNCVVTGCAAEAYDYHRIKACELRHKDPVVGSGLVCGKKVKEIIRLIKNVPAEDQVLLFVQFDGLMKKVASALEKHGISHYALTEKDSKNAPTWMNEFQENTAETRKKVLVLNPSNESAAGANLTNANHIIFTSPVFAPSQYRYDASVTQCIGRARRYGQEKVVYVYHFLSLKTIDVDILQERSRKKLVEQRRNVFELMNESDVPPEQRDVEWGSGLATSVPQAVTEVL